MRWAMSPEWSDPDPGSRHVPSNSASSRARPPASAGGTPTWSRWIDAPAVVLHRRNLLRTVTVSLVVGSILFVINQLDVVLAGDATLRTWIKTAITYVVPFLVANYGVLTATRRSAPACG